MTYIIATDYFKVKYPNLAGAIQEQEAVLLGWLEGKRSSHCTNT